MQVLSNISQTFIVQCVFLQAAALSVTQYLTAELGKPQIPSEDSTASSEHRIPPYKPPVLGSAVARLQKQKKPNNKISQGPPAPVIVQVMEMGFPRKHVEYAAKSLGEQRIQAINHIANLCSDVPCHTNF